MKLAALSSQNYFICALSQVAQVSTFNSCFDTVVFSRTVEPAPGTDVEGLEVVRECLEEVFKLDPSSVDDQTRPHLLADMFSSLNVDEQHEVKPDPCHAAMPMEAPSTNSVQNAVNNLSEASKSLIFLPSQLFTCII